MLRATQFPVVYAVGLTAVTPSTCTNRELLVLEALQIS